jgi:hypothetical protein
VHDVAVAPHVHELDDVDRAGAADPLEVVAAEVDEHDVLGALLGVGEQLVGQAHVVLGGLAARARSGDRVGDRPVAGDAHEGLGAAADDGVRGAVGVRQRNRYMYGLGLLARRAR